MLKAQNKDFKQFKSIEWDKTILQNNAEFKNRESVNYGSSFLIKLDTTIIACTARDLIGTHYTRDKMLSLKDFPNELISWKMSILNSTSDYVTVKSIYNEKRIEKKLFILSLSYPFLTFKIEQNNNKIETLVPDVNPIKNKSNVYIAGYDNENNLQLIQGVVETYDNSKYAKSEIRIKTKKYLNDSNFIGSPIVNIEGKVIGVFNRAYALKKEKIKFPKKESLESYEYFVNGTTMRQVLGKNYSK